MGKLCAKCKNTKHLSAFYRAAREVDGYDIWCKLCRKAANKESYDRNAMTRRDAKQVYRNREPEKTKASIRRALAANRARFLVQGAKDRANKTGLAFDLDQYIPQIQSRIDQGFCEMTGLPLSVQGGRTWDSPSLDRIEPSKGYVYSNLRLVCFAINTALNNWGEDTLEVVVSAWLSKRHERSAA